MELTTYFSDRQRLTLKSLWIPGTILAILGIIGYLISDPYMEYMGSARRGAITTAFILMSIKWSIAYGWEHILTKDYKKAVITIAGFFLLNLAYSKFVDQIYAYLPHFMDYVFLMIVWGCAQVIGVSYIAGKKYFWQIGLVAGIIICYTTEIPDNPLSYISYSRFNLSKIAADFSLPFLIYGWIYLTENYFNDKEYKHLLNTKIQVLNMKEYRFLYPLLAISCWTIIFQAQGLLEAFSTKSFGYYGYSSFFSLSPLTNLINFVAEISIIYITALLTRNIVMSRMTTIASNNGWLYLLHYIPFLNIIAWISFSKKPEEHSTKSENAIFYTTRPQSPIRNYVIVFGALLAVLDVYGTYILTFHAPSGPISVIFFIVLAKLVTYFFLDKGKNAIITLVTLNCIASLGMFIAAVHLGDIPTPLLLANLLGYYFLIEIFHPELEETDATELPEEYTTA